MGLSYSWQRLGGTVDNGFGTEQRMLLVVSGLSGTTPETIDFSSISIEGGKFTPVSLIASQIGGEALLDTAGSPLELVTSIGTPPLQQSYIPSVDTSLAFPSLDRPTLTLAWSVAPAQDPPPILFLIGNGPPVGSVLSPRLVPKTATITVSTGTVRGPAWTGAVQMELTENQTSAQQEVSQLIMPSPMVSFAGLIGTGSVGQTMTVNLVNDISGSSGNSIWSTVVALPPSTGVPYSEIIHLPNFQLVPFSSTNPNGIFTFSLATTPTTFGGSVTLTFATGWN
jgi:hypothetical protein